MTLEEIKESKKWATDNIRETAEELQYFVTRYLLEDFSSDENTEDMVGELENVIANLESYIESLRQYKGKLMDLVDLEEQT